MIRTASAPAFSEAHTHPVAPHADWIRILMAKLAVRLLLAVAASATVPAHGGDPPIQIKVIARPFMRFLTHSSITCRRSSSEARTPAAWPATAWSACTRCSSGRSRSGRPGRTRTSRCSWPPRTATAWGSRTCPPGGGLMGQGHPYFERGNLDIFSGRGPCMAKPPC